MVAPLVKQRVGTLIPTSTPVPYTGTLSVLETINWFSVTLTSTTNCQLKPTTVNPAQPPWTRPLPKNHGLALNKNTLFWVKTCTPLDGQRMDFLDLKDLTIVVLEQTKFTVVTLSRPTTELAFTLASTFLAPMPRSCRLNGSSKLDPAKVSLWVMTSGWQDFCYIV